MDVVKHNLEVFNDSTFNSLGKSHNSLVSPGVFLVIVSKAPPTKRILRVSLPHRSDGLSICVIVKDIHKSNLDKSVDAWKRRWSSDLHKTSPLNDGHSVVFLPLRELKLAYQTFSSKRKLASTFDLFLGDKRILHHLPKKLGKAFYSEVAGKAPIPISFDHRNIVDAVRKKINSTLFLIRGNGMAESLLIGNSDIPINDLKENIISACEKIFSQWPGGGLANIRSIYVQCSSISIPIYLDESEASLPAVIEALSNVPKSLHKHSTGSLKDVAPALKIKNPKTKAKAIIKGIPPSLLSQLVDDLPLPQEKIKQITKANLKTF